MVPVGGKEVPVQPTVGAGAGDERAFVEIVGPYRSELQVHCYRILGSALDAEDALQETLLAAWQGLAGFEGRSSVRVWLFDRHPALPERAALGKQATADGLAAARVELPEPTRLGEVAWLEPFPTSCWRGSPTPRGLSFQAPGR